ncbi:MAG: DUF4468 domain-containing protein [Bacteroidaceae bacterium]|nr:DUF4468 domain-containing protein [Bacteroidaceae bacterium]
MKKILFSIMMLFAINMMVSAASDDSKYLAGAVPEENGMVVFKKSFSVPSNSPQEVSDKMRTFVNQLVETSITAPGNYARVMEDNQKEGIVARVCEWMVFKKKALNLDRTRFRYQISVKTEGNRVTMAITNLTYYYGEDMEGEHGIIFKAEEWISDGEALNKAKTKLYPKSGKFRRKTVDRMEEIFDQAMDLFDVPKSVPMKKVRPNIIED